MTCIPLNVNVISNFHKCCQNSMAHNQLHELLSYLLIDCLTQLAHHILTSIKNEDCVYFNFNINLCHIKIYLPRVKYRDLFASCKVPYSNICNVLHHMPMSFYGHWQVVNHVRFINKTQFILHHLISYVSLVCIQRDLAHIISVRELFQ